MIESLIEKLKDLPSSFDLSDIGNIIGIAIAEDNRFESTFGFEKKDFQAGLHHGISLIRG